MLAGPPFNFLSILDRVDEAIDENADIASRILAAGLASFSLNPEPEKPAMDWRNVATPSDMDKARTTVRQFYRDWSAEGREERLACYEPVIQDLNQAFAHFQDKDSVRVLVPGAGLGRLVFELCCRGYTVEGNEISYHQLIASNWVLNHTSHTEQFDLYPFALEFSNILCREDQLQVVKVPDVHPATKLNKDSEGKRTHAFDRMSMTAADFLVLYGDADHRSTFDAVVTMFFIDTAPNLIRYVEVIHNCLTSGGYWINLGPLLWHFADRGPPARGGETDVKGRLGRSGIEEPGNVELTVEEVLLLVGRSGFRIESHEIRDDGMGYIHNGRSMLQNTYRTSHWVAKKL